MPALLSWQLILFPWLQHVSFNYNFRLIRHIAAWHYTTITKSYHQLIHQRHSFLLVLEDACPEKLKSP